MSNKVKDMALCALFAALMSLGAAVAIPMPWDVSFSIQPFFAMLAGAVLGSKRGAISMLVYTAMGLVGLPVFANFKSGFGMVFQGTFGYIIGFTLCAFATGYIIEVFKKRGSMVGFFIGPFVGIAIDYLVGVPYLYMVLSKTTDGVVTWALALTYGFWPYIGLDILKAALVVVIAIKVVPQLEKAGVYQ